MQEDLGKLKERENFFKKKSEFIERKSLLGDTGLSAIDAVISLNVAEGIDYNFLVNLIAELRSIGVDASITAGGISIAINENNYQMVADLLEKYNLKMEAGDPDLLESQQALKEEKASQ